MKNDVCAYCGRFDKRLEREHVIPKSLYPLSKAKSKIQRLTVPACRQCNNGWADDEAHFRNMLVIAGNPNDPVRELWDTTMRRSFDQVDGPRRLNDLFIQMVPTEVDGKERHMVFPGKDERVLRVVRKIVRGLCHYHEVMSPVADHQVFAGILKYVVPQEFLDMMEYHHREQDICEYKFAILNQAEVQSVWLLTFFERCTFIAGVLPLTETPAEPIGSA